MKRDYNSIKKGKKGGEKGKQGKKNERKMKG